MARKKVYDDDDGRTIADMSGTYQAQPFSFKRKQSENEKPEKSEKDSSEFSFSNDERKMYVLGALSSALLIALAFIVGLGLIVLLMLLIWT
ncbi:MAG: hypothetical protein J1E39_03360 [Eubacterium sp.]|nr:hypothetical protein [Eubacterium sp.]